MMKPLRSLPVLVLAVLLPVTSAAAQAGQQPTVPVELVRALLPGWGPEGEQAPEILVGRLPEAVSRILELPPGARPVGSVVYRTSSTNIVAVPRAAEVAEQLEQRLLDSGWVRAPRMGQGGFEARSVGEPVHLCRGEETTLGVSTARGVGEDGYLRIYHITEMRQSPCYRMDRLRGPWLQAPLPSLRPPPGVPARGGGTSGSSERVESVVFLTTDLTAAELLAHYAAQLRQHGWTALDEAVSAGIAVQTWRFTDEEGKAWHATLLAVELLEGRQREMVLRAVELSLLR